MLEETELSQSILFTFLTQIIHRRNFGYTQICTMNQCIATLP